MLTRNGRVANYVILGIIVAAVFGIWNLVDTAVAPLSVDTPLSLVLFFGPLLIVWAATGFTAYRRTRRLAQALVVATIAAFAAGIVLFGATLIRINVFLEPISHRADWQNLMFQFRASGSDNLRRFVNGVYVKGMPFGILVATTAGAFAGLLGGLLASALERAHHQSTAPAQ